MLKTGNLTRYSRKKVLKMKAKYKMFKPDRKSTVQRYFRSTDFLNQLTQKVFNSNNLASQSLRGVTPRQVNLLGV